MILFKPPIPEAVQTLTPLEGNNLMVIAHPSDETLFGYIELSNPNLYVLCMTNRSNSTRLLQFYDVIGKHQLRSEVWDYREMWGGTFPRSEIHARVSEFLNANKFDNVITHSQAGEYGDSQHIAVYDVISSIVKKNLYTFGLGRHPLSFCMLKDKIKTLEKYIELSNSKEWDWEEEYNQDNRVMNWVTHSTIKRIR